MKPSSLWSNAFRRLHAEAKAKRAELRDTGEWVVAIEGHGTPPRIMSLLPGEWTLVEERETEDASTTVFACRDERAVATFTDHWQAGLFGSVSLYPDQRRYELGLAQSVKSCTTEPAYEDWLSTGGT